MVEGLMYFFLQATWIGIGIRQFCAKSSINRPMDFQHFAKASMCIEPRSDVVSRPQKSQVSIVYKQDPSVMKEKQAL